MLEAANCTEGQLGCADGTCLPQDYFCDGSQDCPDASDEAECDITNDPNGAKECDKNKCNPPHCFCSKDGKLCRLLLFFKVLELKSNLSHWVFFILEFWSITIHANVLFCRQMQT